jgi:hypothetical protein
VNVRGPGSRWGSARRIARCRRALRRRAFVDDAFRGRPGRRRRQRHGAGGRGRGSSLRDRREYLLCRGVHGVQQRGHGSVGSRTGAETECYEQRARSCGRGAHESDARCGGTVSFGERCPLLHRFSWTDARAGPPQSRNSRQASSIGSNRRRPSLPKPLAAPVSAQLSSARRRRRASRLQRSRPPRRRRLRRVRRRPVHRSARPGKRPEPGSSALPTSRCDRAPA